MGKYFIFQNIFYDLLECQNKIKESEKDSKTTDEEREYIKKIAELCQDIAAKNL